MKDLLLVIDMQNVYTKNQEWACLNTDVAAKNIIKVMESGKCEDIIFTKYIADQNPQGVWKDYNKKYHHINTDPWLNEMIDELKPYEEIYDVYEKSTYSSLTVPEILKRAKEVDRVIITGVVAECCVLSTVMHLIDEGIYCIYLTDGVSGFDIPKEKATELVFSGLSPLHLEMMTTQEYLNH